MAVRSKISALAFVAMLAGLLSVTSTAQATTTTTDLTTGLTADQVAQSLVGPGVTVSNVTYTGAPQAAGTFGAGTGIIGFDSGVILGTGDIANTAGPNDGPGTVGSSTAFNTAGDSDLTTLSGFPTRDAAVLEFDFTADADTVFFRYVFGSEEYKEWVDSQFNDVFAFFVNGQNCATVPDPTDPTSTTAVTVNSVNHLRNTTLYRDNPPETDPIDIEMDGLTVVLTCMAPVNVGANTMKLAIADASDLILDSTVWLEQGSLSTTPPEGIAKVTGGGRLDVADGAITVGTVAIEDDQGLRGNLQVNDHRTGDRFHGDTVDSFTATDNTAVWTGDGRFNGADGYRFEATITDNRNGNAAKKGSPDTVAIVITDADDNVVWTTSGAVDLTKGNITLHQED